MINIHVELLLYDPFNYTIFTRVKSLPLSIDKMRNCVFFNLIGWPISLSVRAIDFVYFEWITLAKQDLNVTCRGFSTRESITCLVKIVSFFSHLKKKKTLTAPSNFKTIAR